MSELTTARKAQLIFDLVRAGERQAIEKQIAAASHLAGQKEGEKMWREQEDRAFDRCPYHVSTAEDRLKSAVAEREHWGQLVSFAFEKFMKEEA